MDHNSRLSQSQHLGTEQAVVETRFLARAYVGFALKMLVSSKQQHCLLLMTSLCLFL